ncbi:MAG TPA: hypothetical protein VI876_12400 [Dehalococcoidia bacterium]|nr:hypothetical protein [Dehalococcoidia bacterium]
MKVFVSSSWRNERQPEVVRALQRAGHEVYDFRNPASGAAGFSWAELDPGWLSWTAARFRDSLDHLRVAEAFSLDMNALRACEAVVMLQPAGRSAALELGWAAGAGKPTIVLLADGEPELMLKLADRFCLTVDEVIAALSEIAKGIS